MNRENSRNDLSHDDSTVNTVLCIIVIITLLVIIRLMMMLVYSLTQLYWPGTVRQQVDYIPDEPYGGYGEDDDADEEDCSNVWYCLADESDDCCKPSTTHRIINGNIAGCQKSKAKRVLCLSPVSTTRVDG